MKYFNFKQKSIALILIIVMSVTFFAGCSGGSAGKTNTDNSGSNESTAGIQETTKLPIDIPDNTNYNGYEFKVLIPLIPGSGTEGENEVYAEEESGDTLNDALYTRNRIVESLINVQIKSETFGERWTEIANYVKKIVLSGSAEFDAILTAQYASISMLQEGCLENLYNVPNLDLSKQYWDQELIKAMSYRNSKLYYIGGDINYYDKLSIYGVFFNKRLFTDNGLEYPYGKVKDGAWTIDEFKTLVKDYTRDVDGDGILNQNDHWGLSGNTAASIQLLAGFGERMVVLDNDGIPVLNVLSERHLSGVSIVGDFIADKKSVLLLGGGQVKGLDYYDEDRIIFGMVKNGQVLMWIGIMGGIFGMRDMEDDFAIVPLPKLDAQQESYHSYFSDGWATSYSIPVVNEDLARTGMILEVMAAYSTDILIPAVIDVALKSKFTRDEETADMLEIMFVTKSYDWGVDYDWGGIYGLYSQITTSGAGKFVSTMEKQLPRIQAAMEKTIDIFEELK